MARIDAPRRQFARLSFEDGVVVVTPKDRDIFLISAEKATEACRNAMQADERIKGFETGFLVPLHDWCVARRGRISACYVPVPVGYIRVFIVTPGARFDLDLAEEVASLELQLARSGWRVGVMQLPNAGDESLSAFFNVDGALEIYAQQGSTPAQSGK